MSNWVIVEVPWSKRLNGEPCRLATPFQGPWAIPGTLGVAISQEAHRQGVTLSSSQLDGMLRTLRIEDSLEVRDA